jgi:uncharacterized phiE125 gp8 family phage protein
MTPKIVVEPATELLTIDECRLHLRVDPLEIDSDGVGTHPDDDLIMALQTAAREHCQNFLGLSLLPYTYEVALDEFPIENDGAIELPMGPVTSIVSVTVGTDSDALMDPEDYVLDDFSVPNRLLSADTWATVTASTNTIRIVYTAGYELDLSDGQTIPKTIVQAIKLLLADWYKHREDTDINDVQIPNGVQALLRPHRIRLGMA